MADGPSLATSRLSLVEVSRATRLANPAPEVRAEVALLLGSCLLIDVSGRILRSAANLASASVRTLDAIHLASALRVAADELLAYDARLIEAAAANDLAVASPGLD